MNETQGGSDDVLRRFGCGLRTVSLCIVDEAGGVNLEKSLPSEIEDIVAFLRDFGEEIACVGLEAGTLTQWLTYGLRASGFKPVVLEARHVQAALAAMRNKTDRNDARGIAQILRTGWYRPAFHTSGDFPSPIYSNS